jgi:hypothetical protein
LQIGSAIWRKMRCTLQRTASDIGRRWGRQHALNRVQRFLAQTIRRSACERFWKRHQDWSSSTDCPGTASFNHLVGAGDQLVWNGFSVPIGSLNRLLLWGMFLATLPNSLLRYGCEIFATLRIFLNRVTIQDRFSAEVLSKQ